MARYFSFKNVEQINDSKSCPLSVLGMYNFLQDNHKKNMVKESDCLKDFIKKGDYIKTNDDDLHLATAEFLATINDEDIRKIYRAKPGQLKCVFLQLTKQTTVNDAPEKLKMLILQKYKTARYFAQKIGISESEVSRILSRERLPNIGIIVKMAEALDVTLEELAELLTF